MPVRDLTLPEINAGLGELRDRVVAAGRVCRGRGALAPVETSRLAAELEAIAVELDELLASARRPGADAGG